MTCFEHVLFFFIRRPGDLPVLEAAQGEREGGLAPSAEYL